MGMINQFVDGLERTVRDRIDQQHGSPTMGVVGPNDCRGWATQLRYMIAKQLRPDQLQDGGEQTDFDLDDGAEVAPMQRGDQMTHTFRGVEGACSYHSATVVATDHPSVVTLEAHASKDLTAPEFHVRAGLPGFVHDNDTTTEGGSRELGKKGQRYDVTKSDGSATRELGKIDQLLQAYIQEYKSQDPLMLLQIIQKFKTLALRSPSSQCVGSSPRPRIATGPCIENQTRVVDVALPDFLAAGLSAAVRPLAWPLPALAWSLSLSRSGVFSQVKSASSRPKWP